MHYAECQHLPSGTKLYTSPPIEATPLAQRQARSADTWVNATTWRGLTDEEIHDTEGYEETRGCTVLPAPSVNSEEQWLNNTRANVAHYKQNQKLIEELAEAVILHHASSALKYKIANILEKHVPLMDEGAMSVDALAMTHLRRRTHGLANATRPGA